MPPWDLGEFLACRSRWFRLLRFLCRHGCGPAKRYVARKLTEALREDAKRRVVSGCFRSGSTVIAHEDENGRLEVAFRELREG